MHDRIHLGVNVDHVATVRQQRGTRYPDPVLAAGLAELGGADQITVHLREDRRHISDRDLRILRETVQVPLNLEMAATAEMAAIARETKPDRVTLVPEKREEQTTEGGLDVAGQIEVLARYIGGLRDAGVPVILFVDPDPRQIDASRAVAGFGVELHTGDYCDAPEGPERQAELRRVAEAARAGEDLELFVAGGHGLDYHNVEAICAIDPIRELNIGHSIVARAVLVGMEEAVREMRAILDRFGP